MMQARAGVVLSLCCSLSFACSAGGSKASSGPRGNPSLNTSGGGPNLSINPSGSGDNNDGGDNNNPESCDQAAANRTYIGCDFWPTVTYNPVYSEFKFAVVVANGGTQPAMINVDRGGMSVATAMAPPGGLATIPLPWVQELKGDEFMRNDANTGARQKTSVMVAGGAYHLTSSVPVTAWQFSPLDYQMPAANCAGLPAGTTVCLSVSNDASLLLPSTAMTGNYRLFGRSARLEGGGIDYTSSQGGFAITATANNTVVKLQLTSQRMPMVGTGQKIGAATLAAGPGVTAAMPGDTVTYNMQAGDVVELEGTWAPFEPEPHGDLSGSVLNASNPVQVIALNPLLSGVPTAADGYPDHIETTVLPAEVIGKSYVVAPPTGPDANVPGHLVRFFGNVDGTNLSYPDGAPAGAPVTLSAGEVEEIGPVMTGFTVTSDQPFAVASIGLGGSKQDAAPNPNGGAKRGDPWITMEVTPQQFRKQYTFLAPTSYLENYADILLPTGASATLDGQPLSGKSEAVGANWTLTRVPLASGANDGAHRLEATDKVGLQVIGLGLATGYSYPGGLDLTLISDAPMITVK